MSTQRLGPSGPNYSPQVRVQAIGIGLGAPGQLICAAALALLLALAAWLWLLASGAYVAALLLAALLAGTAACLGGCARSLSPGEDSGLGIALHAGALICALAAGTALLIAVLQALLGPAPAASLPRLAVWTGFWLACAALLALLPKAWTAEPVRRWGGRALAVMAMLWALLSGVSLYNPWWGMVPARVQGLPLLNALLIGYALPAALLLWASAHWHEAGEAWLNAAAKRISALLAALWVMLEVRRAFTGPDLTHAAVSTLGAWLWAVVLIALALAALLLLPRNGPRAGGPAKSEPDAYRPAGGSTMPALRPSMLLRQSQPPSARVRGRAKRADPNWAPPQ